MPNIYVLMGPQGAGKGTQSRMLADHFGLPIVATGDILREIADTDTPLGHHIADILSSGELVADDILVHLVKDRISNSARGCVFDGFPRTLPQALLLEKIADEGGYRIHVIKIDVPHELLLRRLTGRRTCKVCNSIYHVEFKPPKVDSLCDIEGEPLTIREDDTEEAIKHRLQNYVEKTRPLMDYYDASHRVYHVDGTGTPEKISGRIVNIVGIIERESPAETGRPTVSEV